MTEKCTLKELINNPEDEHKTTDNIFIDHPHQLTLISGQSTTKGKNVKSIITCSNMNLHSLNDPAEYECSHYYYCGKCDYFLCLQCYYNIFWNVSYNIEKESSGFLSRIPKICGVEIKKNYG
jgi:hypothetical protein